MKLQNLLYATMVACAFSACSNDDDPNIPDPAQELDATLTVAFNAVGNNGSSLKSFSKADTPDNQFADVKKIGIAVFNDGAMNGVIADGELISYQERTKAESDKDTTACISAKSGNVKVLVVANPTTDMFKDKKDYDGFLSAISDADINPESLLMSSASLDLTLKQGRNTVAAKAEEVFEADNTGYVAEAKNIKVYRNVARIEVPKITVNPRNGFGKDHTAKFTLKAIYVSKVRSSVKVFGNATPWCYVVNSNASLIDGDAIYDAEDGAYPNYIKKFTTGNVVDYGGQNDGVLKLDADATRLFVYDNSSDNVIKKEEATRLVIRGTYEYTTDGGVTTKSEDAYWTTMINNASAYDSDVFTKHCGVLRNVKYLVNVTITGPGSSSEDTDSNAASLTTNIEVVPWGQIVLDPSID